MTYYFPVLQMKYIFEAKPIIIRVMPCKMIWRIARTEVISKQLFRWFRDIKLRAAYFI